MWSVLDRTQDYTLWSDKLGSDAFAVRWRSAAGSTELVKNGVVVADVVCGSDQQNRPTFAGAFDSQGNPQISGHLDYDSENELVILQITVDAASHRAAIAVSADALTIVSSANNSCVCFGLPGGTTATCSTTACDEGISCGTAGNGTNKACRWKAGSRVVEEVVATPAPDPGG